ncbi:MAG: rhombosortase [Desulfuromonadales bacterium]|nr:rhombosortase [Desulfuromonadales bacterium]
MSDDLRTDRHQELYGWLALLFLANFGLLLGNVPTTALVYDPAAVAGGEWWRVATWPWVHVSRYHLLLDSAAFLLLYQGLEARSARLRCSYLLATIAGSLLLPILWAPELDRLGLCGLSGPAHGLLAITALELCGQRRHQWLGAGLLGGLLAKTAWELWSNNAFLQQYHFGDIGVPIVTTHAGGVIGGILVFGLGRWWQLRRDFLRKLDDADNKTYSRPEGISA